jgi:hypothetical protein
MFRELRISTAFLVLGCSSSVELSAPPRLTASSDPTVLAVVNERVSAIAVDEQRIYWLGSVDGYEGYRGGTLHSCEKQNCVGSLVTYSAGDSNLGSRFGLVGGQIYWLEGSAPGANVIAKLHACDVSGCGNGARTVASNIVQPNALAFDSEHAYVSVVPESVLRFPLSGNDAQPDTVLATSGGFASLEVAGGYLYWLGWPSGAGRAAVLRSRTDGTGNVETVAENLSVYQGAFSSLQNTLAVDATYAYWSDGLLSGSVARCPVTGCTGGPEPVVGPIRLPTTLLLDGPTLYWQQGTETSGTVVSSCTVATCTPSEPLARGVDGYNALAVDDEYIYTATADQKIDPNVDWFNPSANIRRVHK